jgi:hypothetical protein
MCTWTTLLRISKSKDSSQYFIDADASQYGDGAVLRRDLNVFEKVIAKTFPPSKIGFFGTQRNSNLFVLSFSHAKKTCTFEFPTLIVYKRHLAFTPRDML